jgi:hypothetical protein
MRWSSCDRRWRSYGRRWLWSRFRCRGLRLLVRFRGGFGVGHVLKMLARKFGVLDVNGTRVGFLLGDADLGKEVNQHLRLDLQLARQLVDSYLIRVRHL